MLENSSEARQFVARGNSAWWPSVVPGSDLPLSQRLRVAATVSRAPLGLIIADVSFRPYWLSTGWLTRQPSRLSVSPQHRVAYRGPDSKPTRSRRSPQAACRRPHRWRLVTRAASQPRRMVGRRRKPSRRDLGAGQITRSPAREVEATGSEHSTSKARESGSLRAGIESVGRLRPATTLADAPRGRRWPVAADRHRRGG